MAYREFPPDPRLRSLVRLSWAVEERHGPGEQEHRFVPERSVRLTFAVGAAPVLAAFALLARQQAGEEPRGMAA